MRRPTRSILSAIGIALAVGSALALLALGEGIERSVNQAFDERGSQLIVARRGATDLFSDLIAGALAPRIAATAGVAEVTSELAVFTTTGQRRHMVVLGWEPQGFVWRAMPLAAGRKPIAGAEREVVVGEAVSEALSKRVGDTVELFDETFTIVGISAYRSVLNRGLIIMPLAKLQELAFREGQVTGFSVRLDAGIGRDELPALKARIAAAGPFMVSETRDMMAGDRNIEVLKAISLAVSAVALGIGMLGVLNTILISVQERTREIGIIAALGWSGREIVALVLVEGIVLSVAGTFAGLVLGLLTTQLFAYIPAIGSFIAFEAKPLQIVGVTILALAGSLLGALYPAWRALGVDPAEALRRL
jgi:putative ABC transport system permease protein